MLTGLARAFVPDHSRETETKLREKILTAQQIFGTLQPHHSRPNTTSFYCGKTDCDTKGKWFLETLQRQGVIIRLFYEKGS